jgi:hypothetical protein
MLALSTYQSINQSINILFIEYNKRWVNTAVKGRYQWATETKKRYGWQGRKYYTTVISLLCGHSLQRPTLLSGHLSDDLDKYYLIVPLNRDHPRQPVIALFSKCCVLSGKATNTNFIVFDLTLSVHETHDLLHANHYSTDVVLKKCKQ